MSDAQTVEKPSPYRPDPPLRMWRRPARLGSFRGTERAEDTIPEGHRDSRIARGDSLSRRGLAVADMLSAAFALFVVASLMGDDQLGPLWFVAPPVVVLVSKAIGLYQRDEYVLSKTTLEEAPVLFQLSTLFALVTWLGDGVLIDGFLGRDLVLGLWGLLFGSLLATRCSVRWLVRAITSEERCLVVGDPCAADRLQAKFDTKPSFNARIVGRVSLPGDRRRSATVTEVGTVDMLGVVIAEHHVHRVIIAPMTSDSEEILHTIRLVKSLGAKVSVVPRLLEIVGSSVEFDSVDGTELLGLRRGGLSSSSHLLKRGMDLVGSLAGLLVLSPFLLAVAAAIKLTSRGPVFFRQPRIGLEGRQFDILKFRSMVVDAEAQKAALRARNETLGLFKIAEDPRVTSVGRFLRRTSLDELPQLLNVLRGEMSLVGPRPLVPDEDEKIDGWHRTRLELVPGMTGFWQVSGSSRIPLPEMVKIDYLYGANWSLWLDVKLLLRTVPYALARRGM